MDTTIRSVSEIDNAERLVYESALGRALGANQQVVLRVITPGVVPSREEREAAFAKADALTALAREHAARQGIDEAELSAAIDEALTRVRRPQGR